MAAPKSRYARWRYALKPASWPKLFVPAFFGQGLGAAHLGRVDIVAGVAGLGLTFLLLAYVVLMNDWADRDVDAIKRRRFPGGCAPKTIPDGILPSGSVLIGGVVAALAAFGWALYCAGWLNRPLLIGATALSIFVFAAYSLPPFRLNYRGGGELLEMLGVGLVLPWTQAYVQGGLGAMDYTWLPRPWAVLPGLMLLCFASAVASGLSDEVSDRDGGKKTFTTWLGNAGARRLTELLVLGGMIAWALAGLLAEHVPLLAVVFPIGVVAMHWRTMRRLSTSAVTNAFEAQAQYKTALHRAIWGGAQYLAMILLMMRIFFG
ncbi:MAG: prenyltransferase [Myxococcota bacterium]